MDIFRCWLFPKREKGFAHSLGRFVDFKYSVSLNAVTATESHASDVLLGGLAKQTELIDFSP